jgi:RNA polymerase sigma-70 factor (ECF subfamily)
MSDVVRVRVQSDTSRVSFPVFFDGMWPELMAFCTSLTASSVVAEEITQETLTRVFARYPLLTDARPYAYKAASNLVRGAWKDQQRAAVPDPVDLPQGRLEGTSTDTIDAVRRLPPRLRDVVVLHYYADQSIESVATLLHRPVGTVKRRLHEARRILAETLQEEIT